MKKDANYLKYKTSTALLFIVTVADTLLFSRRCRKAQNGFLNQIDRLIDWHPIRTLSTSNTRSDKMPSAPRLMT